MDYLIAGLVALVGVVLIVGGIKGDPASFFSGLFGSGSASTYGSGSIALGGQLPTPGAGIKPSVDSAVNGIANYPQKATVTA